MVGCADRPARTLSVASALLFPLVLVSPLYAQDSPPPPDRDLPFATHDYPGPRHRDVLIPAGTETGLPRVVTHDNRSTAGRVDDGVRIVELEVQRADWRIESDAGPGLRVAAIGEVGGVPMVPAPLIRAETGMRIRVILHNRLEAPLQVYGLYDRPEEVDDSTFTVPGSQTVEVEFEAGPVGTYIYSMWEGELPDFDDEEAFVPERDQMAGALIVDPVGGGGEDRILVMNIFGEPVAETVHPDGYLEALTINGRTWPYTDLLEMEVGTTERWRVINATGRNHPMHLHGFYFDVLSKGTTGADRIYSPEERRSVVTETMRFYSTMVMDFTPTRPGRWIFHCHLTFHVAAGIRLPGAREADPEHAESHMSGLVMGIDVAPGPTDLIARGEPVEVELYAKRYGGQTERRFGFDVSPGPPTASADDTPGPLLIFNQYQPADVTVHNELGEPTGVHWHGLELDAWADGVPNWTASDGRVSPAIQPGEAFTYRLSLMRPGTFMYHTHLNDLEQLSGGLYGPLIVLPPGETFDPEHDHPRIFAWRAIRPGGLTDFELNGRNELDDAVTRVGETHRFRLMNIGLANAVQGRVFRDGEPVPIRLLAKDGADLPASQQIEAMASHRIFVGETSDFLWTPTEPGEYMVWIGIGPPHESPGSAQRWTVLAGSPETAGGN